MDQNTVKTFQAASMQAALDLVRRELGPDAVIFQTRELPKPRWRWWKKQTDRVEITAGTGVNVRTPKLYVAPRQATKKPAAPATRPQTGGAHFGVGGLSLETPDEPLPSSPSSKRAASQLEASRSATSRAASHQFHEDDVYTAAPSARSSARVPAVQESGHPPAFPATRHVNHTVYTALPDPQRMTAPASHRAEGRPSPDASAQSAAAPAALNEFEARQVRLQAQLDSIQRMIEGIGRNTLTQRTEIPGDLFQLYANLIEAEVEDDIARDLICRLKDSAGPEVLANTAAATRRLVEMVEADLQCGGPIRVTPGRRRVVALVGPTGVGKTTTIAKLAANFRLRDGVKIGLITVDTYRIAAVEQLRTYAEIIDLPMKVVTGPTEMQKALDELAGMDLVLIDTAGRSPRDEPRIQELKSLLAEAQVDEVHLVLSLTGSARGLEANAARFAPAGVTSLILTKLDEAMGLGAIVSTARKLPLPISYITTGQDVPDDIEVARSARLASLVLGLDRLSTPRRAA
jgi:flagellar biosynthesis protein FlhF